MQDAIRNLILNLEEELRLHQVLYDILVQEKEFLVEADNENLKKSNISKEAILIRLSHVGKKRLVAAEQSYRELGLKPSEPRLKEIYARTHGLEKEKLRLLLDGLETVLARVQEQNKENEALVENALKTVRGAFEDIKSSLTDNTTYQRKGDIKNSTSSGKFVSKEA